MRRTEYLILFGLDETATADDIKHAYWRRAKHLHPDTNSTPEAHDAFRELTEAYRKLRLTTPQHLPVPAEPPAKEAPPPRPTPRTARSRWAGATAFSISIIGALVAWNAVFGTPGPAPRQSDAKQPEATAAMATTPASKTAAIPTPNMSPTVVVPPILMGRNARVDAKPSAPPSQPVVTAAPRSSRVAVGGPTQDVPKAQSEPVISVQPKPIARSPTQSAAVRPTLTAPAVPARAAPADKRAVPLPRSTSANARPRERLRQVRTDPSRTQKSVAPVSPRATPPTPTIEVLNILRSVLD